MFGLRNIGESTPTTPEGKTDFMKEAAKRLAQFDEEIERSNCISKQWQRPIT